MHANEPLPDASAAPRIRAWFRPGQRNGQPAAWQIERPATIDFSNAPKLRRRVTEAPSQTADPTGDKQVTGEQTTDGQIAQGGERGLNTERGLSTPPPHRPDGSRLA